MTCSNLPSFVTAWPTLFKPQINITNQNIKIKNRLKIKKTKITKAEADPAQLLINMKWPSTLQKQRLFCCLCFGLFQTINPSPLLFKTTWYFNNFFTNWHINNIKKLWEKIVKNTFWYVKYYYNSRTQQPRNFSINLFPKMTSIFFLHINAQVAVKLF